MRYINRHDHEISHIYHSMTRDFYSPLCRPGLGIWKTNYVYGSSSVSDEPIYRLCKNCGRMVRDEVSE